MTGPACFAINLSLTRPQVFGAGEQGAPVTQDQNLSPVPVNHSGAGSLLRLGPLTDIRGRKVKELKTSEAYNANINYC